MLSHDPGIPRSTERSDPRGAVGVILPQGSRDRIALTRLTGNEIAAFRSVRSHRGRPGILSGITVLDLTRVMSGPYCTLMLADMGARVIKIEHPRRGDDTRAWGPPFVGERERLFSQRQPQQGKPHARLQAAGRPAHSRRLLERADVLVENFRPGTLQRLGLDYASLAPRVPRLIYASISGYGHTGPLQGLPGYDAVTQAEGGLMSVTGDPEGPPYRLGLPIADLVRLFAAQGVLLALAAARGHRPRSACGYLDARFSGGACSRIRPPTTSRPVTIRRAWATPTRASSLRHVRHPRRPTDAGGG